MSIIEHPVIFSELDIKAILRKENPKTQFRRLIEPQPVLGEHSAIGHEGSPWWSWTARPESNVDFADYYWPDGSIPPIDTEHPYGFPGDILWVQEIFQVSFIQERTKSSELSEYCTFTYVADGASSRPVNAPRGRRRGARHLPREASRIILEVVRTWAERVKDISPEDARKEAYAEPAPGCNDPYPSEGWMRVCRPDGSSCVVSDDGPMDTYIFAFEEVWDNTYEEPFRFYNNPWVWGTEFKIVEVKVG